MFSKRVLMGLFAGLCVACLAPAAPADVKLPSIFSDHMVLQRDAAATVWGWASPDEKVTVAIAGQTVSAAADASGKWSVKLEALQAGGPHELVVRGNNTIKIADVLVGEVWLASGQSNMAMTVQGSKDFDREKAAADFPKIRMFTVARKPAETPQDQCEGKWLLTTPETVGGFSATAYFFGRELHRALEAPVGLVNSSWGGTPVQAWTSLDAQKAQPALRPLLDQWEQRIATFDPEKAKAQYEQQLARWKDEAAKAKAAGKPQPRRPQFSGDPRLSQNRPANLFNGMIAPLAPYAMRGAIWYQGESNAGGEAGLYGLQLRTMIIDWRTRWNQGDFPFLFVQLPNFHKPQQQPVEPSGWVTVREEMLRTLALKNAGMAITVDVGDADDIHPKNKQDVGKRLALWALAHTYGKDVVGSGPIYKSMEKRDGKIVLSFDYAEGGLEATGGGPLEGFAIAGADKKFVWAQAKIEGSTVVVWSDDVKEPAAVRYAWADNPKGNLANKAGLPASPFRTDGDGPLAPVRGRVTLDGQPVSGATVEFVTEAGDRATATTSEDGSFELVHVAGQKGAPAGTYRVAIRWKPRGNAAVPRKYANPNTSGLTAEVRAGVNDVNFELRSQ